VDELPTNSGTTSLPGPPAVVPSYSELDCRLGWHPSPRWELSLVGRNLLHDHHPEYGLPDPTRVQIERSVYGKVAWTP
jgi:iron complex outermembrane recepter protein